MTKSSPRSDQHNIDNVQFKVWLPSELRSTLYQSCAFQGRVPADVVRALFTDFDPAVRNQAVPQTETIASQQYFHFPN